ncbi:hypothetical protein ACFE04_020644 [Oxalis oulophora]
MESPKPSPDASVPPSGKLILPDWVQAVVDQVNTFTHVSNIYYSLPQVELAKQLVATSFADRVFFTNSGTEANEAAIKFARKFQRYANPDIEEPAYEFISFTNSFHGRTMGALALTSKEHCRTPFQPVMPGVTFVEYGNIQATKEAIQRAKIVAGEGGIHSATKEFFQFLRSACDEVGALLVFAELLYRQTDIYKQQPGVIFDYYLLGTYDSKTEKCISESDFTDTSLNLRSSLREDIDKTTYGTFLDIYPHSGRISLRSLIDHSIVESFGGGGKSCITSRIYPKVAINKDVHLYADRGAKRMLPAEIVSNLQTQVKEQDGKKALSITWKIYIV